MEKTVIRYVLNWVEKNLYSDAGVSEVVNEVGYSRSTVDLWFSRGCGMPLGEYLMRRRMSRAAVLLRMTVLPVTEIATLFHFHSSQNFARAFRKITGMTPTQYRSQPEWQFSVLQQPLLMEVVKFENLGWCTLPASTFRGSVILFQDTFLSSDQNVNKFMKNAIVSKGRGHNNKVCIASRAMPAESPVVGRSAVLNVEVILQSEEQSDTDEYITIPSGQYFQFVFSGTWDEYVVFSRMIYFRLAEENWARRDGYDLVHFSFPHDDPEVIDCQYFIPVMEK